AHPSSALYAQSGRVPASPQEVLYLAARALAAAVEGQDDPVAAQALNAPIAFAADLDTRRRIEVYRVAGAALASPAGRARQDGMVEAGRLMVEVARQAPPAPFGAWRHLNAIDDLLIGMSLAQVDRLDPEVAFALLQLQGRRGASIDADALTVLGQAKNELQRRSIHQALRLRARRDRLERAELQRVASLVAPAAATGAWLTRDIPKRALFRDFSDRIDQAAAELSKQGVATSGTNLAPLKRFQATLRPDEAALALAPTLGGAAYMCIRRDTVMRRTMATDAQKIALDARLVQAALTADHAPSEALDVQFPVEASRRLYDALIRPLDGCLRAGDRILWLPHASLTSLPLSVLLEHAPPKIAGGYDLAAAPWLMRVYAVTFAGSASAVIAARSQTLRSGAGMEFLGVGDPLLTGVTASGENRAGVVARGVRSGAGLAALAPLPETRDELERSAKGFRDPRLLLGDAATEGGVRGQLIGSYRYLSFATHGLLRDKLPGLPEPALALTPVSASDAQDDGLLTASEIADLNLAARFVALSACNTANFDLSLMAAELPALATAFAIAGVPSTLATLWPVDSETSKQVVAAVFARLQATPGEDPAVALVMAQRAFLANPPGKAWLHPRFWAPFIVLGDSGAERAAPAGRTSVEVLSRGGGEVTALARAGDRLAVRFMTAPTAKARGSATRVIEASGAEVWRQDVADVQAARFLTQLGSTVLAGGQTLGAEGRYVPIVERLDAGSGRVRERWSGDAPAGMDTHLAVGTRLSQDRALFAVVDLNLRGDPAATGPKLRVFAIAGEGAPRPLFAVAPQAASLDQATLTPVKAGLLVTYTERFPRGEPPPSAGEDDFDSPICLTPPITWVELRDLADGALLASKVMPGWVVAAVTPRASGALLGGSFTASCTTEAQAAIATLDAAMTVGTIFQDISMGSSEVRAMGTMPGGAVVVAANKHSVVDFQRRDVSNGWDLMKDAQMSVSGMVFTLSPQGHASAPVMLDAGSHVFVEATDTARPGEATIGGVLAGEAAIFRLTLP
ncbi:CHAT domain-containing protein, partial [Phenylobacterium sp.]|uniref:CHAT domain-containing protein n=1 Tax=Phenylobacterium sp. TaxID=1871053 RepID=UPI0027329E8F